tara:strand:+ start:32 stop:1684 length:1653 start_codon:yes stop_codon:yes gene_type:complete
MTTTRTYKNGTAKMVTKKNGFRDKVDIVRVEKRRSTDEVDEKISGFNTVNDEEIVTTDDCEPNYRELNLASYKKLVIDFWDDHLSPSYYVDFDIQRYPYFTHNDCIKFLQKWMSGYDINPLTMVDINKVWSYVKNNYGEASQTYIYFANLSKKNYYYLSIDGNNRNHAWYWFFKNEFALPKGFVLPLWNFQTNKTYRIKLKKKMFYKDIIRDYQKEFEGWMKMGRTMIVCELQKCTKPQLHNIFRTINQGKSLESQEDRNCINVFHTEWVRDTTNKGIFKKFFKKQFKQNSRNKRNHDSFVAFVCSLIQNHGNYFPSGFGEKALKNISEKIVTSDYEKENISDETRHNVTQALKHLKGYIKHINSGSFISDNLQFSRVLTCFLHKIRTDYNVDNWDNVYDYINKFHSKMLSQVNEDGDEITYKFDHHSKSLTYGSIVGAGVQLLSVNYQFLSSQLHLMELNGIINKKLARKQASFKIRQKLYNEQNGICKLTGNKIVDFNDTDKYHVDHIIPISKWLKELDGEDPNNINNLQLVEKKANLEKGNKTKKSS